MSTNERPFDPYAPPEADILQPTPAEEQGLAEGVWREAERAVALKGTRFPDRCVKCNDPAEGYSLKRLLTWHHPAYFVLIVLSVLIYIIVGLIVRKRATVFVGLCPRHRRRRKIGIIVGWGGVLVAAALFFGGFAVGRTFGPTLLGLSVVSFLATTITGLVLARVVTPTRIDKTSVWLRVGAPFLVSLKQTRL